MPVPQEVGSVQVMTGFHLLPHEARWHGLTLWTSSELEGSTRVEIRKCGHFILCEVPGEDATVICYERSKHWMALYEAAMGITSLVDSEKLHAASWHYEKVLLPVCSLSSTQHNPDLPQEFWSSIIFSGEGKNTLKLSMFLYNGIFVGSCSNPRYLRFGAKVYFNFFWISWPPASEFRQTGFVSHCYHYLGKTYLSLSFPDSYVFILTYLLSGTLWQ